MPSGNNQLKRLHIFGEYRHGKRKKKKVIIDRFQCEKIINLLFIALGLVI